MNPNNEHVNQKHMQEAIELLESFLPLNAWNFKRSAQFFDNKIFPVVIYDSENCRIKALYEAPDRYMDHRITIHYGRKDVSDSGPGLLWKNRKDYYHLYWHSVHFPLQFLEKLSPREAIDEKKPRLVREFEQSGMAKEIKYEPEKILVMHATIWSTCGYQLFEIFDVRNMSLWNQYSAFVREFWEELSRPKNLSLKKES